ncbi:MAG: acetoacetate decarboxylase family protein, partial [Halobacteriales archaeon]
METGADPTVETLSTGQRVRLPLEVTFDAFGGTFLAAADRLRERLPEGCVPVRIAPGVGTIVLTGVHYRDVGGFEPYDEFAVIVPCVRDGRDLPLVGAATGEVGGFVDFLPVTTEASVALGQEIWGYPKDLAEVRFDRRDRGWSITLEREGRLICRLRTPGGRPRGRTTTAYSYTTKGGRLLRTRIDIDGPFGIRPFDPRVRVDPGADDYGRTLDGLLLARRSVASLTARNVVARLHGG